MDQPLHLISKVYNVFYILNRLHKINGSAKMKKEKSHHVLPIFDHSLHDKCQIGAGHKGENIFWCTVGFGAFICLCACTPFLTFPLYRKYNVSRH